MEWSEGPVWIPADSSLLVSDVIANTVYRWKEGQGLQPYIQPSGYTATDVPPTMEEPGSNGLTLDSQGRLVMAQHGDRRIARRNADGTFTTIADRYDGKRFNSPNDLVYGPNGDLYFTDPAYGLTGQYANTADRELDFQGVYRISPSGTVTLVARDLNAPNGIGISPDGRSLYVSSTDDSTFSGWMVYPLNPDGSVGTGRTFALSTVEGPGSQDGLELDENGNLWATGKGGVHVFAPDGTLLGRIVTDDRTGNVTWGDDGSVLYIAANHRLLRVKTATKGMVGFQHQ
jgi:gluconolactonase